MLVLQDIEDVAEAISVVHPGQHVLTEAVVAFGFGLKECKDSVVVKQVGSGVVFRAFTVWLEAG